MAQFQQSCTEHVLSPTASIALMCQIRDECARQCDGESIEMQHAFESDISHVKRDEFFRANGLLVEVTPNIPFVDPDVDKLLTEYKEWFATVLIEDVSLEDVLRSIEHFPDCLVIHSPYQISLTNTVDEDCIFGRFDIPPFISLSCFYENLAKIQCYLDALPSEVSIVIWRHYPHLRRMMPTIKSYHPSIGSWMCRRYSTRETSLKELTYTVYEHCNGFRYQQIHPTVHHNHFEHLVTDELWRRIRTQLLSRQQTRWLARRLNNQRVQLQVGRVYIHKAVLVLNTSSSSSKRVPECFKPIRLNTVDNRERRK